MSSGKLLFSLPSAITEDGVDSLIAELETAGFIGAMIEPGVRKFFAGDRFLQLITFMGCSPFLKLEPDGDSSDDFCSIWIRGPYTEPRFVAGSNTRPPRCPRCRQRMEGEWQALVERWKADADTQYNCPRCHESVPFEVLEWRQNAGAGRLFVEVTQIFPGEAVPVQALMDLLGRHGSPWNYFYIQE